MPDHVTSCSNSPRTSGFIQRKYLFFSMAPGDLVPCHFSDPISYDHALVHSRLHFIESSDSASNRLGIPLLRLFLFHIPFLLECYSLRYIHLVRWLLSSLYSNAVFSVRFSPAHHPIWNCDSPSLLYFTYHIWYAICLFLCVHVSVYGMYLQNMF